MFGNLFLSTEQRIIKKYTAIAEQIGGLEKNLLSLSDEQLKTKATELKAQLKNGKTLDDILSETFALTREASRRISGERHYDVQLVGAMIINDGKIAEMRTGEGKTLVATLPVVLNALGGRGVHIVTVNDYLARRDAVWMGRIYNLLGLSVGVINNQESFLYDPSMFKKVESETETERKDEAEEESYKIKYEFLRPCSRKEAYQADITYGTNSEFGFDYLRDNIEYNPDNLRQRELHYAIVDEIDSILIDEARTPLIISAPTTDSENLYTTFAGIARQLEAEKDYTVDEKMKAVQLTQDGITHAENLLGVDNIYTEKGMKYVHHLETAVRAKALFLKDREYVVDNNQVIIVDESTGRKQPGRRWSDGLHQAVEAKEGVNVQKEARTFASITYQNYFRMYQKLGGMTGTAKTSSEEFLKTYGLEVITVPTNKVIARKDYNDLIYQTELGKFKAVAKKIKDLQKKGQPVLVGTVSVEKNELLSEFLDHEGVKHTLLNAKNHEREGEIVANAGLKGAVTIATNMAGRGVDIKLGGVPFDKERYEEVKSLGGLFVMGTERHDARRIDNQLRGRAGRQGDPGETQFMVSLEDHLMRVFASDGIKNMMGKLGIPEEEAIENKMITRGLENAQTRIEGFNFDARKHVLQFDDVLNKQRSSIYERRRGILLNELSALQQELEAILLLATEEEKAAILTKQKELSAEIFWQVVRHLLLQTIDTLWVDHLETMDYLRSSVNLRAYGQRDPLVEYKKESLRLFKELEGNIVDRVIKILPHLNIKANEELKREEEQMKETVKRAKEITAETTQKTAVAKPYSHTAGGEKVGRNDPCPCGSGKKYKKCHGQ